MKEQASRVTGKIIKLSSTGWGFISSKEIPFTRIFFHWTALRQDTLLFPKLEKGMVVEFTPLQLEGRGYRAMHIRVLENVKKEEVTHEEESGAGIPEADVIPLSE
jgi:cold shock CspA family protein